MLRGIVAAILWQHVIAPLALPALLNWLTVERWATRDPVDAHSASPQYAESSRSMHEREKNGGEPFEWTTSILGIINGITPWLGFVVVACFSSGVDSHPVPPYIEVRKVWW